MTKVHQWITDMGTDSNQGISGSGHDSIYLLQRVVTLPAASRALRLIASCGLAAVDQVDVSTVRYGYPMVWRSSIGMAEGPSVRYPFGRAYDLNEQAGEFVTSVAIDPAFVTTIAGTFNPLTFLPSLRTTNWAGHMDHVDQPLSIGSMHEDIGTRDVQLQFETAYFANFTGIPGQISPDARIAWVLKVLVEVDDGR
jgi:hypothetical protein